MWNVETRLLSGMVFLQGFQQDEGVVTGDSVIHNLRAHTDRHILTHILGTHTDTIGVQVCRVTLVCNVTLKSVVYYESINRELKRRLIYEYRCDERLKIKK
jgi:hypothetical protein